MPKDADENMKHEIKFIIKSNESLAQNKIKNDIGQLLSKYRMEIIFVKIENSKTNKPNKFVVNLSYILYL